MTTPTVTATGQSRRRYSFYKHPLDTPFKAIGGVYMVLKGLDPLYVGQTEDLSTRFGNHHKESCWLKLGAETICVMVEASEQNRLFVENDLLANYSWPCND